MRLVPTHGGGAIAAWLDMRGGPDRQVYAQCVTRVGRTLWGRDGAPVCTHAGDHSHLGLAADGGEGAFVSWGDTRPEGELYATRLAHRGVPARGWELNGSLISGWPLTAYGHIPIEGLDLVQLPGRRALLSWTALQTPPGDNVTLLDLSFATLLTPDGPAASPTSMQRSLTPAEPAGVPTPNPRQNVFALRGVHPNPASSGAIVSFTLPEARAASLEMFDIAGRRIWSRGVGELGPGEHDVQLRDGSQPSPGLYLVRLTQGERTATTRVAIVK